MVRLSGARSRQAGSSSVMITLFQADPAALFDAVMV